VWDEWLGDMGDGDSRGGWGGCSDGAFVWVRTFLIRVKSCIFDEKVFVIEKKVVILHSILKE
jgi:hypothetical protein